MNRIIGNSRTQDDSEWMSVADLMAGLMVIFLFIAIVFLRPLIDEREKAIEVAEELRVTQAEVREIVVAWQENEASIYDALMEEFESDLLRWNAEIEEQTLLIRFKSPDVLFEEGRSSLRPRFESILDDFFPRYVRVLDDFKKSIEELRIEGHTSSIWNDLTSPEQAYIKNMELSQTRTRSVLQYALSLGAVRDDRSWVQPLMTANGLSSSRTLPVTGVEDPVASRRVEFRLRTKARSEIVRILKEIN
jgi:outer membrane protein OmpA-like peptidoglycan-associated protein